MSRLNASNGGTSSQCKDLGGVSIDLKRNKKKEGRRYERTKAFLSARSILRPLLFVGKLLLEGGDLFQGVRDGLFLLDFFAQVSGAEELDFGRLIVVDGVVLAVSERGVR